MSRPDGALPAWGVIWIDAVMREGTFDAAQWNRGRGLVARGAVSEFTVEPGSVGAAVRGRSVLERRVRLGFRRFTDQQWSVVRNELAGSGRMVAAVLEGSLPRSLSERLEAVGCGLLPGVGDVSYDCTCGGQGEFCVHVAAVSGRLADALDDDPLLLVTLRGGDRSTLVSSTVAAPRDAAATASDHRSSVIPGRPSDPGVAAGAAWRRTPEPWPDVPSRRRAVGRARVGAVAPSAELGFDQHGLDRLVLDAARRAATLLGDDGAIATTGLELDVTLDAARRSAASTLAPPETAHDVLASTAGVSKDLVPALTAAWARCGAAGVEVLVRPRRLDSDELAAVRETFEVEVKSRSTGAVLPGGRQVRRSADGTWVVLFPDDVVGWRVVDFGEVLDELELDGLEL